MQNAKCRGGVRVGCIVHDVVTRILSAASVLRQKNLIEPCCCASCVLQAGKGTGEWGGPALPPVGTWSTHSQAMYACMQRLCTTPAVVCSADRQAAVALRPTAHSAAMLGPTFPSGHHGLAWNSGRQSSISCFPLVPGGSSSSARAATRQKASLSASSVSTSVSSRSGERWERRRAGVGGGEPEGTTEWRDWLTRVPHRRTRPLRPSWELAGAYLELAR
jgi:hypothetical protein